MSSSDAQKSEVHDTSADASTSPTAKGDRSRAKDAGDKTRPTPKVLADDLSPGTRIVRDDTSDGGPLIVESDDPDLNPPQVPIDPFPTDGTPEINPPVERGIPKSETRSSKE